MIKPTTFFLLQLFMITFSLFVSQNIHADEMSIKGVEINKQNSNYTVSAKIDCDLSEEAIEALQHGVALQILVDIKTQLKRNIIWNKTINHSTIAYKIEFHPLTERYLLTELNRYIRQDFQYLSSALDALGVIKDWPLIDYNELDSTEDYLVLIRAKLDLESLPAPLRPMAFISKSWHLSSDWQQWDISL